THDGSIAVSGQRDGHALASASHSVGGNELLALLRPDTTTAREYPRRPGLVVVGPAAHEGGVAVGGERHRHAQAGACHGTAPSRLLTSFILSCPQLPPLLVTTPAPYAPPPPTMAVSPLAETATDIP